MQKYLYLLSLLVSFWLPLLAPSAQAAAFSEETLLVDGRERRFLVHDYSGGATTALVIVLHGGGGNGANAAEQTGFDRIAEREGLVAVYPYGTGNREDALLSWNAGNCCVYAMRQNVDDVHFIDRLIDHLLATRSIDPARVYATGLSNGGMLTHRLGIELGERLAAIAPVISGIFGDEPLRELSLPVLVITGAEDRSVRPEGGYPGGIASLIPFSAERPLLPASAQSAYWAAVNDCADPTYSSNDSYQLTHYVHCRNSAEVAHYVVLGSGHSWPGGTAPRAGADTPVDHFDANEVIWAFFARHTRAASGVATDAWYYDGYAQLPVVEAGGLYYRVRLQVIATVPALQLQVDRLRSAAAPAGSEPARYRGSELYVPFLQVGPAAYSALLQQTSVQPLRFTLQRLQAL